VSLDGERLFFEGDHSITFQINSSIMDKTPNDYHISFFKPTTPQAVANRNMVVWLVLIWFFAIFGFHFLLWLIEKPTPEPAFTKFEKVWPKIEAGTANESEIQTLGQSTLSVLGKMTIAAEERLVLDQAMSWAIFQLSNDKDLLVAKIREFEELKAEITELSDPAYITAKRKLSDELGPLLNISPLDVRSKILPLELTTLEIETMSETTRQGLPTIMKKYLIHNQSFLTDFKFLGFPFHYFYTSVFLLILFVGLCWLYCVRTDQLNAKMDIID
jgi:putative solute:sodium symporter small subunit